MAGGAFSQDGSLRSERADVDFTADAQYRAIKRTATGITLCGAADAGFIGVLQDDVPAGEYATYKIRDVSKAVAGAAIAAGARVTTDADARFVTAVAGNPVMGRAEAAAAALGDIFALEIEPSGVVPA